MFLKEEVQNLDNYAIVDEYENCLTYRELETISEDYAEMVPSRSLIAILCDYDINTVAFYYSMMNNSAVPILLSSTLDQELLGNLINAYRPEYIWTKAGNDRLPDGWQKIIFRGSHVLIKTDYGKAEIHKDLALLLSTSGSTGSPKFVRISRTNLVCNTKAMAEYVGLRIEDRGIATLPFYFCLGMVTMHMHWYMEATFYITSSTMIQEEFWDFVEKNKITNFSAVPYQYQILNRIGFIDKEYPFFRFSVVAGGALDSKMYQLVAEQWGRKGIKLLVAYGQTEGSGLLAGLPYNRVLDKAGSIGLAAEGLRASIYKGENGEGELVFEGTSVGLGYASGREDLNKGNENQGILHTGDIAYMDSEGYIFLRGRLKRFIKLLGIRFSLDGMEKVINNAYGEGETVCVGSDERVIVYYTGKYEAETLREYCIKKFSIKKTMIQVKHIEKIPRNESGKVLYSALM